MFDTNPLKDARKRVETLAKRHGDARIRDAAGRLSAPSHRLERALDGPAKGGGSLDAFRVRFTQGGEPTKGGVRFSKDASLDEAERLALLMTLKCALLGLPFGGAKGAVRVDASDFSDDQKAQIAANYARAFKDVIGPDSDVPAPDVSTGPDEMAAMADALGIKPGDAKAPVTGLPADRGGLDLRTGATGEGAWRVYRRVAPDCGGAQEPRIAVQGYGKGARGFVDAAVKDGARIVAVADSRSLARDPDGISPDALNDRKSNTGRVGDPADPLDVLKIDADVLVLAARSDVVDETCARKIAASAIVEIANAPVTRKGYERLEKRNIWTAPDILANAGGVLASYFEWREHENPDATDADAVRREWEQALDRACDAVLARKRETNTHLHVAALLQALDQLDPKTRPRAV
ncbi:MAG: Glu/Leu/Phe/Val dehydrogenase dimerization domain-containing protein [Oceanicaulis sp.]